MRTFTGRGLALVLLTASAFGLSACGSDGRPATEAQSFALTASRSYLLTFAGGTIPTDADAIITAAGGTTLTRYTNLGVVLARSSNAGFAGVLRADARIDAVGAADAVASSLRPTRRATNVSHSAAVSRNAGADPLSGRQWDMDQIRAPQARAVASGRNPVLVGVLDSGADITHPDLVGQVNLSASASCVGGVANPDPAVWANDVIGHGTHVAGLIAGARNNIGIVGVAPQARIAAVKVANDDVNDPNFGLVFADAFVCAIDWAVGHNFDLMNASLTIDPFTAPIDDIFCSDQPDREAIVKMVRRAILAAGQKRITMIAAAGNFFTDLSKLTGATPGSSCKVLPVQLPRVIGVSAVGYTQLLSFYSNYGKGAIDVTGPGGDGLIPDPLVPSTTASGQILSSVPPNSLYYQFAADWDGQVQDCSAGPCSTYAYLQGTSQATPHVTGVSALAIARFGKLTPEALHAVLSVTSNALPCPVGPYDPGATGTPATCTGPKVLNSFYGTGEIDALSVAR